MKLVAFSRARETSCGVYTGISCVASGRNARVVRDSRARETWVAPRVLRDMRDACISACLPGEKYTYCDTMLHLVTLI